MLVHKPIRYFYQKAGMEEMQKEEQGQNERKGETEINYGAIVDCFVVHYLSSKPTFRRNI
jgi:hypothetical protein